MEMQEGMEALMGGSCRVMEDFLGVKEGQRDNAGPRDNLPEGTV